MLLATPLSALAGEPRYQNVVVADDTEIATNKQEFLPDMRKVLLFATAADMPSANMLKRPKWPHPTTRSRALGSLAAK
jgi:hypothetical protein